MDKTPPTMVTVAVHPGLVLPGGQVLPVAERLSLAQPAGVLRAPAEAPGDARGEKGDAGDPGEHPSH
jgi:hypothetical protein